MKKYFTLLFAFALSVAATTLKAQTTDDFSEYLTTSSGTTLGDNWVIIGDDGSWAAFGSGRDYVHYNEYGETYVAGNSAQNHNKGVYLVLKKLVCGTVTFKASNGNSNSAFNIYVSKASATGDSYQLVGDAQSYSVPSRTSMESPKTFTYDAGSNPTYIAFCLDGTAKNPKLLSVTYTEATVSEETGLLAVSGDKDGVIDYGMVEAGATRTLTLSNPGKAAITVDVTTTGGFTTDLGVGTQIAAQSQKILTIAAPAVTANGSVTITPNPAVEGVEPVTVQLSCVVKDPKKVFVDFADGTLPQGWTTTGYETFSGTMYNWTVSEGYISYEGTYSESYGYLTSPRLVFANGERIIFESSRTLSSYSGPSVEVEYSVNGEDWSSLGVFTDDATGVWKQRSVTIPVDGVRYIRFKGYFIQLRNIYGGELPNEPVMMVTPPASLDFGIIDGTATKTFTISNIGGAVLEGITATSSSEAFTLTGVPTTLAAGASAEVTITVSAADAGAMKSVIKVNATGMDEARFTVSGIVIPEGFPVVDFNADELPTGWKSDGWILDEGTLVTNSMSPARLTSPKVIISRGDFIVVKVKSKDNETGDYLTVEGSTDNGTTWGEAYSNKIELPANNSEWSVYAIADIPAVVNRLRFVGFYAVVDEIMGLTYAPDLAVMLNGTQLNPSSEFDFGECSADSTITYHLSNVGVGSIDITDVAIVGPGADAYTTNWTETVSVPFDLTVTRIYNAAREEAATARITLTTSEGRVIIQVTGTDKAAEGPVIGLYPAEDANFGTVVADSVLTYSVFNAGAGLLSVNIASDNEDFVVAPAELTEIAAGDSATFTIAFHYTEGNYGTHTANITITQSDDAETARTIVATAKIENPEVWHESFDADETPQWWTVGDNWKIADGVAKGSFKYGSTTYLVTPMLTVIGEDDELTFAYKATSDMVSIRIQVSKDSTDFVPLTTIANLEAMADFATYTITGLEAGTYQFRFRNDDYQLDNFEGFSLLLPEHIAAIVSDSIPESTADSITMKVGRSFEAKVVLEEGRGKEEPVVAKLYMGEEVIGLAVDTLAAMATDTLTIVATPTVAAPEGAEMHIKVEWAGDTLVTEPVIRHVADLVLLTLSESVAAELQAGAYDTITVVRHFEAGYNTICLPFGIDDVAAAFGADAKAYEFLDFDGGLLQFSSVETLTAGMPYVVKLAEAVDSITLADVTVTEDAVTPGAIVYTVMDNAQFYMIGTYSPSSSLVPDEESYVICLLAADGQTPKAAETDGTLTGYNAYFMLPSTLGLYAVAFDDEVITGIQGVSTEGINGAQPDAIYTLSGQRTAAPQRGLYIIRRAGQTHKVVK